MRRNKKLVIVLGLAAFVFVGIAASGPPKEKFHNLKVLPKDISLQTMDKVMEEFCFALGVNCSFCHVHNSTVDTLGWDMASDAKPEKEIGRSMIRMTNKINKKFFKGTSVYGDENALMEVKCVTCHHGAPHPEEMAPPAGPENKEPEKKEKKDN
jgi:hypothetical protein